MQQLDLFYTQFSDDIYEANQPEIPALLLDIDPVLQQWNHYDEGSWENCYDCL